MITENQYQLSAASLNVDVASIKAVAEVESSGSGIIAARPVILFEPHVFWKELRKRGITPALSDICYPKWGSKPYPKGQDAQYARLDRASQIHREAALSACSWGKFQILGNNWKLAGCNSLQQFINKMFESEDKHLEMFVSYIKNTFLDDELRSHDWSGFAAGYNGPLYRKHGYHLKLPKAHQKFKISN